MSKTIRIGLIGLDTSHVSVFSRLLNDLEDPDHIPGAQVTTGFPGGSPDLALSIDRVEKFTSELRDQRGVRIVGTPEEVAEAVDLVMITSVDGRVHRGQFERIAGCGKPVFMDKPFALTSADAREMLRLAEEKGIPLMSCSSLRYAEHLAGALSGGREEITGCDVSGPMAELENPPGLFWYGCHSVEMMVAIMGTGCREVRCFRNEGTDLLTAEWNDGRVATLRGSRASHHKFGALLHRKDGAQFADCSTGRSNYVGLLNAILASLPMGSSAVPPDEMIEVVRIIEAANTSRVDDGCTVAV